MSAIRGTVRGLKGRVVVTLIGCVALSAACGEEDGKPRGSSNPALCEANTLESDLDAPPLLGPGVDPATGQLRFEPGATYVVSSTFGVPKPGPNGASVTERYQELFGAIQEQLMQQPGLLAMGLASSESCASGRTLAVWRSEEEMYDFVTSPPHLAAMREVNDVLEPNYAVTHWSATKAEQVTWEEAVRQLGIQR